MTLHFICHYTTAGETSRGAGLPPRDKQCSSRSQQCCSESVTPHTRDLRRAPPGRVVGVCQHVGERGKAAALLLLISPGPCQQVLQMPPCSVNTQTPFRHLEELHPSCTFQRHMKSACGSTHRHVQTPFHACAYRHVEGLDRSFDHPHMLVSW